MRPAENPLDLNNLPDDYGKQHLVHEDSSSSAAGGVGGGGGGGYRKKKSGGKDGKDDGKVYECRFCSLKFCKSQALGGHMNRHRQERETETLNRARQLVFNNDNLASQGTPHLSCQPITAGGCYGDPMMSFRPLYSPRVFPPAGTSAPPAPPQPYPYPSPSRIVSYPPQAQAQAQQPPVNDYYVGHVLGSANHHGGGGEYTYIGAPVGRRDGEEGLSWGRAQINRFQDGF